MIILGCDHAGFELKEEIKKFLIKEKHSIVDVGAFEKDKEDDFSKYVVLMRKCFDDDISSKIIAVCGTGIGMSIGLNKHKGIRCVVGHDEKEVIKAREHNNVNALALAGRTITNIKAKKIVNAFLNTEALSGKYKKRMDEIEIK